MWQVYQTAKTYQVRASDLLGVSDPWTAYCVDNAVARFGSALEAALDAVTGKNDKEINKKRERIMEKWLDIPRRFKSPMASREKSDVVHDVTVQGGVD
jgi:hypothetical protein